MPFNRVDLKFGFVRYRGQVLLWPKNRTTRRRRAVGVQIGNFPAALDESLRVRSQCEILDFDEPDRRSQDWRLRRKAAVHTEAAYPASPL
jgi:hypothetical protein